jgi:hypothetical protein
VRWIIVLALLIAGCDTLGRPNAPRLVAQPAESVSLAETADTAFVHFTLTVGGHGDYAMPSGWYATAVLCDTVELHGALWGDEPPGTTDLWMSDLRRGNFIGATSTRVQRGDPEYLFCTIQTHFLPLGANYVWHVWQLDSDAKLTGLITAIGGTVR